MLACWGELCRILQAYKRLEYPQRQRNHWLPSLSNMVYAVRRLKQLLMYCQHLLTGLMQDVLHNSSQGSTRSRHLQDAHGRNGLMQLQLLPGALEGQHALAAELPLTWLSATSLLNVL